MEKDANVNRIKDLIKSAFDQSTLHVNWKRNQIDNEHEARIATISRSLSTAGHFKQDRLDDKKAKINDKGSKCKQQNVSQQATRQHKTSAVSGLAPHGKLVKARNMDDLRIELLHRNVPEEVISDKMSERKEMSKMLEMERLVMECGVPESDALAYKAFKKLSNAPFKLSD